MIAISCIESLVEAEQFREQIDALNLQSPHPDPFSSFAFYQNYLRNAEQYPTSGQALKLWFLLAFSGDQLVGYLALKQTHQRVLGLNQSKVDLLTAHVADRPHLVTKNGFEQPVCQAIYAYLMSRRADWSLLEFQQQDAASLLLQVPSEANTAGHQVRRWPNMANATIPIRWPSLACYFAGLPKKTRSNVSRQLRALMMAGEVEVLSSSNRSTLPILFERYRSIETQSWKATADGSISDDPKSIAYYLGLMEKQQPMRISIQLVILDGVPIAGLICGAFDKGLYALQIAYDDRYSKLSPGSAVFFMGVRLAIESKCELFDLLWGFGYYKTRWLAEMHETLSLQVYRIGSVFYWRRVLGDLKRRFSCSEPTEETTRFNPARRAIGKPESTNFSASRHTRASSELKSRHAALVAQIRSSDGEYLSSAQLAAVLPFQTQGHS